jgi:cellulose synthase/poly-beta-1,6-N-acetylglucosamine synthase-like glycosyltransferase
MEEVREFGEDWQKVKHVVIILLANEPPEVVKRTIDELTKQTLPLNQIAVVVATEGRIPKGGEAAESWRQEMESKFGAYIVTIHPDGLVGEIIGKSANEAWAAREAKKILVDERGWDVKYMTITSNDSDAIVDKQYFACLSYKFLDDPNRYRRFWQPVILYYNNIWQIPAPTRVVNTMSNMWQLGLVSRKDRLVSFSNYSLSMSMIDEVGYWDTDVIPEDYRIFFKCFFKFEGKVEVEPIYLPSWADAAESVTTWKTFVNEYEQKKRWAWGVSDLPLFVEMYLRDPKTSFVDKTLRVLRVVQDHILWPVNWFIITAGVSILSLVNPSFSRTTLGYTLPRLTSTILSVTVVVLVVLLYIDLRHRPKRPKDVPIWRSWLLPFEFVLMPVVGFFFSALPALDAHTRLMLKRYIEYRVTEKKLNKT